MQHHQRGGCWICGLVVGGPALLPGCCATTCAVPGSEKHGACAPGRCISTCCLFLSLGLGRYCGSFQSLCVMVLLHILVFVLPSLPCSDGSFNNDGDGRRIVCMASMRNWRTYLFFFSSNIGVWGGSPPTTPSVTNYKSFQKSWRDKNFQVWPNLYDNIITFMIPIKYY